jgi:NAD(P)-dependent dehydrogenase (short-subunit alcohol dehydrogenase family)
MFSEDRLSRKLLKMQFRGRNAHSAECGIMLPQRNSCGDQMRTISEKTAELLSLEGKVAMVTGAASGIGRGIALRLAELGAAVVILDIDTKGSQATAAAITELGGTARFQKCDVRSSRDCQEAVAQSAASFGKVDILCNNAGVVVRKGVTDLREDEWDLVLDVTLKGIFLLSREVLPRMIEAGGGVIINTG